MKNTNLFLVGFSLLISQLLFAQDVNFAGSTLDIPSEQTVNDANNYDLKVSERLTVDKGTAGSSGLHFDASSHSKKFHAKIDLNYIDDELTQNGVNDNNTRIWDASKEVGTISGNYTVDAIGGFNYSIPIQVPPGSNGVTPQISINYSSNSEIGILGSGWSIGGLSSISRTSKNKYYDGKNGPLLLNDTDPFVLDGARLIEEVIGSNTVYKLENEDYSIATKHGGDPDDGPDSWQVQLRNGTVAEYGNSTNSTVTYSSARISWLINKVTDLNGNYIEYKYRVENDQVLLDEIWYTGNGSSAPYNKIKFTYIKKANTYVKYFQGYEIHDEHLLDRIITFSHGSAVLEYQFIYQNTYETFSNHISTGNTIDFGKSQLREVKLSSMLGGEEFNSTLFQYNDREVDKIFHTSNPSSLRKEDISSVFVLGDFNNDGITDVGDFELSSSNSNISSLEKKINEGGDVFSSSTPITGFSNSSPINTKKYWDAFYKTIRSTDLDGDGDDDLLISELNSSNTRIKRILENTIDNSYMEIPSTTASHYSFALGDVTGDGIPEGIGFHRNPNDPFQLYGNFYIKNYDTDPNGTQTTIGGNVVWGANPALLIYNRNITPFDYDGDGTIELLFWKYSTTNNNISYKILDVTETTPGNYSISEIASGSDFVGDTYYNELSVGDFNGDGIADFLAIPSVAWKNPRLITHNGTGNFTQSIQNFSFNNTDKWFFVDVNGDRLSDMVRLFVQGSETGIVVYYSKGSGFCSEARYDNLIHSMTDMGNYSFGDFNGDNALDLFYTHSQDPDPAPGVQKSLNPNIIYFVTSPKNFKLHAIRNGLNQDILVNYIYNSDPDKYIVDPLSGYNNTYSDKQLTLGYSPNLTDGNVILNKQVLLVKSIQKPIAASGDGSNPILAEVEKFLYAAAIFNRDGKGLLGLIDHVTRMPYQDIRIWKSNFFNPTCNCLIPDETKVQKYAATAQEYGSPATLLYSKDDYSHYITSLLGGKRFLIQPNVTTAYDYINGKKIITDYRYYTSGPYEGNIEKTIVNNGLYQMVTEIETYGTFGTVRPESPTKIIKTKDNFSHAGNYSTTTELDYFVNGNLKQDISYAGTAKATTTNYTYDSYGNVLTTTTSANGLPTLLKTVHMDQFGQYVEWEENIKGQKTYYDTWKPFGLPLSITSANNNTISYTYNGFGRKESSIDPNSNVTSYEQNWDNINGSINYKNLYYTKVSAPASPTRSIYYDYLNREVQEEIDGWNDKIISSVEYYQQVGTSPSKILKQSIPRYSANSNIQYINYEYDDKQRIKKVTHPQKGEKTYTYSPVITSLNIPSNHKHKTTILGFDGESTSKSINAAVELVEATDNGGTLTYAYNDQGLQKEIKLGSTIVAEMEYDPIDGTQTYLKDANVVNPTNYEYDAYGRLKKQWDLKSTTDLNYNNHNELITKVNNELGTVTYSYINSGDGLNQISSITHSNGSEEHFTYDNLGRNTHYEKKIDNETYRYEYSYNQLGQLISETYPSGFAVNSQYTTEGFLEKITDAGSGNTIWEGKGMNHFGQYVEVEKGDGQTTTYTFDELGQPKTVSGPLNYDYTFNLDDGNLDIWTNNTINKYEDFDYDNLNRLDEIDFDGDFLRSIDYYDNGNIKKRDEPTVGNTAPAGRLLNYNYGSSKPNAVTSIEDPDNIIADEVQDISYNAFHQPESIDQGNYLLNLTYGADGQRLNSKLEDGGTLVRSRTYLPNYEKQVFHSSNKEQEIHYIGGGDGLAAIYVIENGVGKMYYTYTDYLGSILKITDDTWLIAEQSFDAWGRKRNASDWTYTSIASSPDWLIRGYTGHEHYEEFNLINMNGRMYDPIIGRMLSIDNYVQDVTNTQNYNRYSYVLNNPLKYTDPSGEKVLKRFFGSFFSSKGIPQPSSNDYATGDATLSAYVKGTAITQSVMFSIATGGLFAGLPFASTLGIITSSTYSSLINYSYSGGHTDIVVGFGMASYNFSKSEFGYYGKIGNSTMENIGYALGAIANVSDVMAGFNPGEVQLNTEHTDGLGHSAITKVGETNKHNSIVSVGPETTGKWILNPTKFKEGTNNWKNYVNKKYGVWKTTVKGANVSKLTNYGKALDNGVKYNLYFSSCVNHTARALTISGVPTVGIHPFILHSQIALRSAGVRPMLMSSYFYQY